jgi:CheY-like chemotaxis protein
MRSMSPPGLSILFVHNRIALRSAACLAIWRLGYWADVVSSSSRALKALQKRSYDLVILALDMPDINGYATARAIRGHEADHGLPHCLICAVSPCCDDRILSRCRGAGISQCISDDRLQYDLRELIRLAEVLLTQEFGKGRYLENPDC